MERCGRYLLIIACLSYVSCATLFTEQQYIKIDIEVKEEMIFSGVVYSIPEKAHVRKIVLLGSGTIQNIDVYARDARNQWKLVKEIQKAIQFPFELPLIAETDAIRIAQRSTTGKGHIKTIQFYTIAEKSDVK